MGAKESTKSLLTSQYDDENDVVGYSQHSSYGSISDHDCKSPPGSSSPPLSNGSHDGVKKEQITYTILLRKNPNFRYFLLSYVINKIVSGAVRFCQHKIARGRNRLIVVLSVLVF